MVIRQTKDRVNNLYSIELMTEFDSNEIAYMSAYGEPKVELGGTISYNATSFNKTAQQVLIRSQFPVRFELDAVLDVDGVAKVDAWALTVRTRLQTVLTTLLGLAMPAFPNTTVFSLHGA